MTEHAGARGGAEPGQGVGRGDAGGLAQHITTEHHRLVVDEPRAAGGTDAGPSPYDLLLAALGACTSMALSLSAARKQWPLESVTVTLRHSRIHAADSRACETTPAMLDRIERDVELHGTLTEEQVTRLLDIAGKCPVHRTLSSRIDIVTRA